MAYSSGRIGAVETEVGSYNRASALYISFERRGCQNVPGGQLNEERYAKALEAKEFFMKFLNADCPRICVENPMPLSIMQLPKPDCIIRPYEFGEPYTKRTYLWLKGLPPLMPTCNYIGHTRPWVDSSGGKGRKGQRGIAHSQKDRSKTFPGIAKAMAEQWGKINDIK